MSTVILIVVKENVGMPRKTRHAVGVFEDKSKKRERGGVEMTPPLGLSGERIHAPKRIDMGNTKTLDKPAFGETSLKGKCILVTGGTTGIGRTIAKFLAEDGAKVLIFGRHEPELQDALDDIGGNCEGFTADQAEEAGIEKIFREVDERLGGLDVLINNAAISAETVADTEYKEIEYAVQSNLVGYLACAHEAVKRMKKRGQGDIVNIGSISAVHRSAGSDIYTATKAGVAAFSDSLRKQVQNDGIRVLLVEPGLVGSDMTAEDYPPKRHPEMIRNEEMLMTEDIADMVRYMLMRPRRCDIIHVRIQEHKAED